VAWSGPAAGGPEVGIILTAVLAAGGVTAAASFAKSFGEELGKDVYVHIDEPPWRVSRGGSPIVRPMIVVPWLVSLSRSMTSGSTSVRFWTMRAPISGPKGCVRLFCERK
jgi:hypothetical protein